MTAPRTQHVTSIAQVRNQLAETINRARYRGEVTVLTHRRKPVVAVVPLDFYERALAALGEQVIPGETSDED